MIIFLYKRGVRVCEATMYAKRRGMRSDDVCEATMYAKRRGVPLDIHRAVQIPASR